MTLRDRIELRLKMASIDQGVFAKWYLQDVTEQVQHITELLKLLISVSKAGTDQQCNQSPDLGGDHPLARTDQESGTDPEAAH